MPGLSPETMSPLHGFGAMRRFRPVVGPRSSGKVRPIAVTRWRRRRRPVPLTAIAPQGNCPELAGAHRRTRTVLDLAGEVIE
jgi:hypothetical protein